MDRETEIDIAAGAMMDLAYHTSLRHALSSGDSRALARIALETLDKFRESEVLNTPADNP